MKSIARGFFLLSLPICAVAQGLPGRLPNTLPGQQPAATSQPASAPTPAPETKRPPRAAGTDSGKAPDAPRLPGKSSPGASSSAPAAPAAPANTGPSLAGGAAANTQAVNPDVMALRTTADLVIKDVAFSSLGEVTFNLINRGEVGINVPGATLDAKKIKQPAASGPPITIDIYIGTSKMSVQQASLGGKQTKNFKVALPSNIQKPRCLDVRNLKVVADPLNQIPELHDDNNVGEAPNSARPCPDLAIKSIKRDYEGLLNETYRVKVTIVNQGNALSPPNQVWATSLPGGVWPVTGWPELVPTHTLKALEPGATTSFKVGGSVLSANKTAVRVVLDRDQKVDESDEGNNFKDDRL